MEMSERMTDVHKDMFCRMLGVEKVPDSVVEQYFRIKRLVDKVDGRLTIVCLAGMVLDYQDYVSKKPEKPAEDEESSEIPADEQEEEKPDLPAPEAEEPSPKDEVEKTVDIGEEEITPGMQVEVFQGDEILKGKVVGQQSDGSTVKYQVEVDGRDGAILVTRDEIEVE